MFAKELKDIIIGKTTWYQLQDTAGQMRDFLITAPVNGASGRSTGIEIAYQQYFDKLPGLLSGFGVAANYTGIDSSLKLGAPARLWCTPKDTVDVNLALLYDKGPFSARLAYAWRSKYLQAVNPYGTNGGEGIDQNPDSPNKGQAYSVKYALPTWGGDYGQFDLGVHYKVSDNLTLSVEGQNLNDALYKQYMQQGIGLKERYSYYTGRRYTMAARYTF